MHGHFATVLTQLTVQICLQTFGVYWTDHVHYGTYYSNDIEAVAF